ncbi:unnamed protein product [Symbiodinium microadriaticum]|nr:unnamed protein product [Symbiodinium microadriaticum]
MNPNQYDDGDEQVMMRPNVTEDPGRRRTVASNPIVNGVDPPSGGHLDMDGEVTGPRVENTSSSAPTRPDQAVAGVVGRETRGAAAGIPKAPTSASDFLQTSTGNEGGVPSDGTHPTETPLGVHAQPLGSSMSGPGYQFEEQRQPRTGDSVEYASVASSVTRRDLQRGIPAESQVPGTPLFDLHTMERLQQLHAAAPQLLGSSPVVLPPRPPSTTSSDIQAEVRRQLTDVVAVHEEESRNCGKAFWLRRIETMILAALPQAVKQEVSGTLPDAALQVRALTKLTKGALQGHPDIFFRVNLVRHNLQVDVTPDQDKAAGEASVAQATPTTPVASQDPQQQIKSFDEDYACISTVALLDSGATHPVVPFTDGMTGVGRNTCPFIQEDQALSLISQLEDERLKEFKEQVRDLEVKMESVSAPIDPTEALRKYATSGRRSDALRAVYSQPYFDGVAESIKARLAEDLVGLDENSGKRMLKQLPVNRAHRRSLLTSERWVVHLCSGSERGENPLKTWCQDRDMQLVEVDVVSKGGKGWDLMKSCGVWRALLWAAATGRIVSILSSPNPKLSECVVALGLQPLFLWSLASVAKGRGIPFLFETPRALEAEYTTFAGWANASLLCLDQGLVDPDYSRCMQVCTNLNLSQLCASSHSLEKGRYTGPSCEELDQVIARALRSGSDRTQPGDQDASEVIALGEDISLPVADDLPQPDPEVTPGPSPKRQLSKKEIEAWKQHISDGHVPYRTSPLQEEQDTTLDQDLVEDLAEYEPSEPGEPLDDELRALLGVDEEEGLSDLQEFQPRTVAVADFESLLEPRVPTKDPEELQALIEDLKRPVNQVVLRYFVPLKTKTGQDVLEGLQRLVLDINKRYPVKILHSDPGTEFSSYALTRWAASQGSFFTYPLVALSSEVGSAGTGMLHLTPPFQKAMF